MRIIKLIVISFIVLFLIVTGVSLLIPSHIRMSKVVMTHASKDTLFQLIKDKNQWHSWHPLFKNIQTTEQQQVFEQMKTEIVAEKDSVLQMQWKQPGKKTITNRWEFQTDSATNTSTLQWHIDFELAWYPWEKLGSMFYENSYGAMMEQGLLNLKQVAEKGY